MEEKEIIKLKNVTKIYNQNQPLALTAIKNINLTINEGEFLAIMGESGSGKTTLLNLLSAMIPQTSGEVSLLGKKTKNMSEEDIIKFRFANVNFIFQDYNLLDNLTVYENIALLLKMNHIETKEIEKQIDGISEKLGIKELYHKYPIACSGGQQQRIAIARAIVSKVKIIVADEPTGNLDSANSKELMELFKILNQDGITIILVTHNHQIASYSSRFVFIHDGEIREEISKENKSQNVYYKEIITVSTRRGK